MPNASNFDKWVHTTMNDCWDKLNYIDTENGNVCLLVGCSQVGKSTITAMAYDVLTEDNAEN